MQSVSSICATVSGIINVPNGDSDFDQDFCACDAGAELQVPQFNPLDASAVLNWFNA
jgi:hypothetical protein